MRRNKSNILFESVLIILILFLFNNCTNSKIDNSKKTSEIEKTYPPEVENYNYILGTQTIDPAYKFTEETGLVESAREIRKMGSNLLKIALASGGNKYKDISYKAKSLQDLVENEPSFRKVIDMDFTYYMFWAYGSENFTDGLTDEEAEQEYKAIYDLTTYLLKQYNNTGKTFYIGHWEGDWHLVNDPESMWAYDRKDVPTERIQGMTDWLNIRQKAVDDAKAKSNFTNVEVYHYTEVCLIPYNDESYPRITNKILPYTNVDYVSYSCYDATKHAFTHDDVKEKLGAALDYIELNLKPKPEIKGKRVWIGEYGYPVGRGEDADPKTSEQQDSRSRNVIQYAMEWGCPFILYWEIYNNEIKDGKQNGFWMIDDSGAKQPIYNTHKDFYKEQKEYVNDYLEMNGHLPSDEVFKEQALKYFKNKK